MAYLFGDANAPSAGKMSGLMAMNRCPTVAEAIEIIEAGMPEADRGASEIPVYESDYSSGTDAWYSNSFTAVTGGVTAFGVDDTLQVTVNNSGTSERYVQRPTTVQSGKRQRFKFEMARASGNSTGAQSLIIQGAEETAVFYPAADDTWEEFEAELLVDSTLAKFAIATPGGNHLTLKSSGDTFHIKNFSAVQVGVTADLPPSSLQLSPGLWLDESDNGKHVVLPDGIRTGEAKTEGVLFAENEFTASAIGQPICADLPVLPADCQVALMMKATVEATFNIGDGSVADYYASAVTIGTSWQPVALSEHASDGTNRKIVVTPTASYSGVVSTKVKVERLA